INSDNMWLLIAVLDCEFLLFSESNNHRTDGGLIDYLVCADDAQLSPLNHHKMYASSASSIEIDTKKIVYLTFIAYVITGCYSLRTNIKHLKIVTKFDEDFGLPYIFVVQPAGHPDDLTSK
ncbi:unnamed protein product, partial [Meganyctiphanes norvegica]